MLLLYFNGYYYLILVLLVELQRCLYVVEMLRPAPVLSNNVVKVSLSMLFFILICMITYETKSIYLIVNIKCLPMVKALNQLKNPL